jgi:phosphatidylinositol glycan class O
MLRKLNEMSDILDKVMSKMDDDTLLVLFGDHGMTTTGDYGGDSLDELQAGLMFYSKTRIFDSELRSYSQIDLVPTLAWLTGVPIPFSNLGTVMADLLPPSQLNAVFESNYRQVKQFVENHAATSIPADQLKALKNLENDFASYLSLAQSTCRKAWVEFDGVSMINGLVFGFVRFFSWLVIVIFAHCELIMTTVKSGNRVLGLGCALIIAHDSIIHSPSRRIRSSELFAACKINSVSNNASRF